MTADFEDKRTAVIEKGLFGGTCLNVGCIPTKMFVYAAEVADIIRSASRFGVDGQVNNVRWADIRDRIFGRIDPIAAGGRDYRRDAPHTDAYLGHARFVGERAVEVQIMHPEGRHQVGSTQRLTGDQVVIATGSRPRIPQVVVDGGVDYHTSDTIMRIEELPASMVILGGGVIAAEFAHVFSALGVKVSIVLRGPAMLRGADEEISTRFTNLARERWDVHTDSPIAQVRSGGAGVEVITERGSTISGEMLLVATGRIPNADDLGLEHTSVRTHQDGRIIVDEHGRTDTPGVWALGDVSSPYQLKHVANHEARVVAHNLAHPQDLRSFDHRFVPEAVFSSPQMACVGLTEEEARMQGYDVSTKVQAFGDTAYGWAMEDTTGVVKMVGDRSTGKILGAHIFGPHASTLIQPVLQALNLGPDVSAHDLARGQYWIHPALSEVLENALLGLEGPDRD